jgi:hypothetical protein
MVHSTGALKPCGTKATGWHGRNYIRNEVYSRDRFSCCPEIESFAVGEFFFWQPLVSFGSFALPSNAVEGLLAFFALIYYFVDEKFLLPMDSYRVGRDESS